MSARLSLPSSAPTTQPVSLQYFAQLLVVLAGLASPGLAEYRGTQRVERSSPDDVVRAWLSFWPTGQGSGPVTAEKGSGAAFLRLLFPTHDGGRRLSLNEKTLCKVLGDIYCLFPDELEQLTSPTRFQESRGEDPAASEGIGIRLVRVLSRTEPLRPSGPNETFVGVSLVEADAILDQLAALCDCSTSVPVVTKEVPMKGLRAFADRRRELIARLLHGLDPLETGLVVQALICREPEVVFGLGLSSPDTFFDRLSYPTASRTRNMSSASRTRGPDLYRTMAAWHPALPSVFAQCARIRLACEAVEQGRHTEQLASSADIGVQVEVCSFPFSRIIPSNPDFSILSDTQSSQGDIRGGGRKHFWTSPCCCRKKVRWRTHADPPLSSS